MTKALYTFSADPITIGHIDIVERASKTFDIVLVGIGSNPDKKYTFTLEERLDMAIKALKRFKNVTVMSFSGLAVDFAYEQNISVIIKGIRNSIDMDYENILHQVGEHQNLDIETFVLFARQKYAHISSSVVKALQKDHGLIHEFVPLHVKHQLEFKISNQFILGVTGEIASGKSFITDCLKNKYGVYNIDMDIIGHQILGDLDQPRYIKIREDIVSIFGKKILTKNRINRKILGKIVFNNPSELKKLNTIMRDPLLVRLRKELQGKTGIIVINAALLAELNMLYLCNNNVVLIRCSKEVQENRLLRRGLTHKQIETRLSSQYSYEKKKKIILESIKKDGYGTLVEIYNNLSNLELNLNKIIESLGLK